MHRLQMDVGPSSAFAAGPSPQSDDAALRGRRICIVLAGLGAGGAERVVAWLAELWAGRECEVTIVTFDEPTDPIYHRFPANVRLVRLGIDVRRQAGQIVPPVLRRVLALRRTVRALKPDLVVSFLTKINTLALAATIGMGIPVIVSERNNPQRQPAHWLWSAALRLLCRRATAIVCQTDASTVCIPAASRSRVHVIPNPVAMPAVTRRNEPAFAKRIVGVGRLERQKGFDLLISAFAKVVGDYPEWQLDIWGTGPDLAKLQSLAQTLGVSGDVHFRGLSAVPGGWLAEADVFVLSSRFEGFPNVLGEAMSAGLPVVAVDCDFGPAEMVEDGVNGLLVPVEDVDALASAISRILGDVDLRRRVAAAAPEVSRTFSPERVDRAWLDLVMASFPDLTSGKGQRSILS